MSRVLFYGLRERKKEQDRERERETEGTLKSLIFLFN